MRDSFRTQQGTIARPGRLHAPHRDGQLRAAFGRRLGQLWAGDGESRSPGVRQHQSVRLAWRTANYGPAFLPAAHQATTIGRNGKLAADASFEFLESKTADSVQVRKMELLQQINGEHFQRTGYAPIEGMIRSMEMAFRMQSSAPPVIDISQEPEHVRQLYGIGEKETDNYGRQCLLARHFAEAGVRYIQVSTPNVWDQHSNLHSGHEKNSLAVDKPIAGLLTDLKHRGLLDDTLVVWSGEFGRTPIVQGSNGRDHNPQGFTVWMAGGGVKGGFSWGKPTNSGISPCRTKSTCTTSTPRCCICWASTTSVSPTATPGAISA